MIQWDKVARPQPNAFDSIIVTSPSWNKVPRPESGEPTFCDGMVAIRHPRREYGPTLFAAPYNYPTIFEAERLLRLWPEGYLAFKCLIGVVYPLLDSSVPLGTHGSTCGSDANEWGMLYATVYDALGFAEACLHEMGHQKLRGLGVFLEHALAMIVNDPLEEYESPIRKDKPRPMTAVFHAQYSYTHVVELDYHVYCGVQDDYLRGIAHSQMVENFRKIKGALLMIKEKLRVEKGKGPFFDGYYEWFEDLDKRVSEVS